MSQLDVRTLLIVDDEPVMLETLGELLAPMGITVIQANSAEEALDVIARTKVTAILSDIRMPGFSGLDFLEKLRASGSNIPFVFMTASNEKENVHRALQLGAIDFIDKPFQAEALKDVIFKVLEIGVRQNEVDSLQERGVIPFPKSGEDSRSTEAITKKNRMINLLRIKLPWQKAK